MKRLEDIPFKQTFGDVPESFSHRVQYALRHADKEEKRPMKSKTLRTIILTALFICLTTVGLAAALNHTIEYFGWSSDWMERLNRGATAPGGHQTTWNGVTFTLYDAAVLPALMPDGIPNYEPEQPRELYATGYITAADENIVLMPWGEYQVDDPAGYALFYGSSYPAPPEGAPTYADLAREKGLDRVRMVSCIVGGLVDDAGNVAGLGGVGYDMIAGMNGTVDFTIDQMPVPEQATYKLSIDIGTVDVDLEGNIIEGTKMWSTWVIDIIPEDTAAE